MIILLGFPKSGTTSFNKLFQDLGLNTYHWKKNGQFIGLMVKRNKQQGKPLLSDFEKNDCITQLDICKSPQENYWPQIVDFKQLYKENKDSLFILNKRNPQKILESFKKWNNYLERLFTFNPELVKNKTELGFLKLVQQHYQSVERFFKNQKRAKFLVFDIEKDNPQKLSKYIDIQGIKEFPWENKNTPKNNLLYSKKKKKYLPKINKHTTKKSHKVLKTF